MSAAARALLLVGVALQLGCLSRRTSPGGPSATLDAATATPSSASIAIPEELSVGALPRGHVPRAAQPGDALGKAENIDGLVFDSKVSPPRLSGVKDALEAFNIELRDQEGAALAYCLGLEAPEHLPGYQPVFFAVPAVSESYAFHAERIQLGTTGPEARLNAISVWATAGGQFHKSGDATIPMVRIGAMSGVEVFAFLDEASSSSERSFVNIVVRRPPLRRGQARYASFVVTPADGPRSTASCTHARASLALERGNGSDVAIDVAVEGEQGVRAMRVQSSLLWLSNDTEARISTRLRWLGPERPQLALQDLQILPRISKASERPRLR